MHFMKTRKTSTASSNICIRRLVSTLKHADLDGNLEKRVVELKRAPEAVNFEYGLKIGRGQQSKKGRVAENNNPIEGSA